MTPLTENCCRCGYLVDNRVGMRYRFHLRMDFLYVNGALMVKSAERVIQIFEFICQKNEGYTHSEIADTLDIPKSSLTALLSNLVARSYLNFDPLSKRYSLGPQLLSLAGHFLENLDLAHVGKPIIKELSIVTGESVALAIVSGNQALFVGKENSPQAIMGTLEIGAQLPFYATASGKALLAFRTDQEIEHYLAATELIPVTDHTITDPDIIRRQIRAIRRGEIAPCEQEFQDGISAFGAPVFDMTGQVVAALTIAAPTFRMNEEKRAMIKQEIKKSAAAFSRQLGHEDSTYWAA
jgi:DNA-binding IclR family transcriptional regulator